MTDYAAKIATAVGDAPALLALAIELVQEVARLESHKAADEARTAADATRRAKDAERKRDRRSLAPDVWPEMRGAVLDRDNYTCRHCGNESGPFHIDHIVPVARGGLTEFDNLQVLCARCNLTKGARFDG